ncbi:MAG: hypothetical protein GC168_20225 [Candidatus Hydrogenedens sp.]|nr:hypothetical protein [Candidatus Hydrogenedens sp.]
MIFVKTFKGYEDKVQDLDRTVNEWIAQHKAAVRDVKTALSHENNSRAGSGDLVYTVLYEADASHDAGEF